MEKRTMVGFNKLMPDDISFIFDNINIGLFQNKKTRAIKILNTIGIDVPDDFFLKVKLKERKIIIGSSTVQTSLSFKYKIAVGLVMHKRF